MDRERAETYLRGLAGVELWFELTLRADRRCASR